MVNPFKIKPIEVQFRSTESEIMDDFLLKGTELKEALDKIASINQLLGGNKLTLQGIKLLVSAIEKNKEITIIDVGCGNGDMLRCIADYGLKNNYNFKLIGIDANEFTINHAIDLSKKYNNISFRTLDIFDTSFNEVTYDIALCTLTLHHFNEADILYLLQVFINNSKVGFVINDLHRSKIAYRLFQLVCAVFKLNKMSRQDGLTSILRGFNKKELINFAQQLNIKKYTINWKWAFRYQWIVYNNSKKSTLKTDL